jgi:hypothetical protein
VASKKPSVNVTYDTPDLDVLKAYAASKKLTPAAFLKFAAQQYMDRYPRRIDRLGGEEPKAVHPEASEAKSNRRVG